MCYRILFLLGIISIFNAQTEIQKDSTGLPGDHFSLEGALDLFKNSANPEEFEKKLNQEDNHVNNLDLNEDGQIDYVKVIDQKEGDNHAIILRAVVGKDDEQDVAVIEIEKKGGESADLQILGDEDLYGKNKLVEPYEEEVQSNPGKKGPTGSDYYLRRVWVNVWFWPCVRFIYAPGYALWVSPWYWGYYPGWWRPWRPHPWRWFRNHFYHTHFWFRHYHYVGVHRVVVAHRVYTPHRRASVVVVKKVGPRRAVRPAPRPVGIHKKSGHGGRKHR